MAYVRKFRTGSGAVGVQVCWKKGREVVRTEHIGSAHTDEGVERLLRKARKVIDAGKSPLFDLRSMDKK
ncbi:hypothetical protein IKF15_00795 [Candidatus Saccharibacteria bacterium]|nr:hypothetical protein [Candidatus Saccharibacteria bacterium]